MKKIVAIILLLFLLPILSYSAMNDESGSLIAIPHAVRTLTFTNPARILTIVCDGPGGVQFDFVGTLSTGTTAYQIKSGESQTWSFDIAGRNLGVKYMTYASSTSRAYFRYHAITY